MENQDIISEDTTPQIRNQIVATLLACLGPLMFGFSMGYSSPAIPELEKPRAEGGLGFTDEESSWFSSLINVGAILGGPFAAVLIDKFSRKVGIMLCCVPYAIGWLLIILAEQNITIYIGRVLTGVGTGMCSVAVPTYIAEISSKELRGATGACFQLSITIGVLVIFLLGLWISYVWMAVVCSAVTFLLIIGISLLPQSPSWLIRKGLNNEAVKSLTWLRGNPAAVSKEYKEIEDNLALQSDSSNTFAMLTNKGVYKPLFLILGTMFFQQISGINAVIFNSESIFKNAGFSGSPGIAAVILAIVQVIMTFVSCLIMDKFGRKILLIVSGAFMSLSCVTFSLYYIFDEKKISNPNDWYMKGLSLGSLIVYISMFSIGWGPVPWLYMSEILPSKARGVCSGFATFTNWTVSFFVTKFFTNLKLAINDYGVFFFFAGTNFLGVLFVCVFIIETKGITLEQIERIVNSSAANYQPLQEEDDDEENIQSH